APDWETLAGPVSYQGDPQALFATESLAQALRQLEVYGHDGLPVLSADGRQVQGWITAPGVLRAIARQLTAPDAETAPAQATADGEHADPDTIRQHPPTPLPGYRLTEIAITSGSPAAGQKLKDVAWPLASMPLSVLRSRRLRPPHPELVLAPGDHVSLLTSAPDGSPERPAANGNPARTAGNGNSGHA
ncbi:MAG TPA: TrkA C-terminal domain-containing protein, partial [Streptosporangiaceae bacterium]